MKSFTLRCISDGEARGKWTFEPSRKRLTVFDAHDREVCRFPHSEANDRFTLPSFWRSIKNIALQTPDGATVEFEPDSRSVARVKDYLEEAIASQGIEAVDRLSSRGWTNLVIGLSLILFGFLALGTVYVVFEVRSRLLGYLFMGMVFGGIGDAAWGASALARARRVRSRLESDEA